MKPALPTAPSAYGLNGPLAAVTVDNATPQGSTYRQRKSVQTNGSGSSIPVALSEDGLNRIFQWCLGGVAHSFLTMLDGGTMLADSFRISVRGPSGDELAGGLLLGESGRKMFEKLKRLIASTQTSTEGLERLDLVPDGFRLIRASEDIAQISWQEIEEVTAFKRDLITTDLICIEIRTHDDRVMEFNEEVAGFEPCLEEMQRNLHGFDTRWHEKVVKPAFAANKTVLFSKTA